MFVGGLDLETTSESLKAFFERFGEVEDSVVMRDGDRCSRGFGFITYTNMASLDSCLKSKPHVVDGKEVSCLACMSLLPIIICNVSLLVIQWSDLR